MNHFEILLTLCGSYIASSMDELPVLALLLAGKNRSEKLATGLAYLAGSAALIAASVAGALGVRFMIPESLIHRLGLIPAGMGLWILLRPGEDDKTKEEETSAEESGRFSRRLQFAGVFLLTLSLGVDDIAIYLPLFSRMTALQTGLGVTLLLILAVLWCWLSDRVTTWKRLFDFAETHERLIEGGVFLIAGLLVFFSS